MKMTYDPVADAAYLSVVDAIAPKEAKKTQTFGKVNFDYDRNGKLLGIEFLDARETLREDVLKGAMLFQARKRKHDT